MCNGPWSNKGVALFIFSACVAGAVWGVILLISLVGGIANSLAN